MRLLAKTKALISFAVTAKLICAFVFAYADCWLSHEAAHNYCRCALYNYTMTPSQRVIKEKTLASRSRGSTSRTSGRGSCAEKQIETLRKWLLLLQHR